MINYFIIYFCISGIICWYLIHNIPKLEEAKITATEKELEQIKEIERLIYTCFGTAFNHLFPLIQILCLLFGWLIIPICILQTIAEKFQIKVE